MARSNPGFAAEAGLAFLNLVERETLTGNRTLTAGSGNVQRLDPGGSARDVTLPAEASSKGGWFLVINAADAAENLVVKDDGGSTIGTMNQNDAGLFSCDGTSWTLECVFTIALA